MFSAPWHHVSSLARLAVVLDADLTMEATADIIVRNVISQQARHSTIKQLARHLLKCITISASTLSLIEVSSKTRIHA